MDIADLDAPQIIGFYEASVEAIDHNMYIIGDKMYQSNYLSGLRVLDLSDAAQGNLELVGYFDTNPESDAPSFNGTWSNFPYFPSGNIAVSTFTHFFMVRPSDAISPETVNVAEASSQSVPTVFPNPASTSIRLEGFDGEDALQLFNAKGQLIREWQGLPVTSGLNLMVNECPAGVYILKGITTGTTARFLIAR